MLLMLYDSRCVRIKYSHVLDEVEVVDEVEVGIAEMEYYK